MPAGARTSSGQGAGGGAPSVPPSRGTPARPVALGVTGGAAGGLTLAALQGLGAWAADLPWTLEPASALLAPPVLGAAAGGAVGLAARPLARRGAPWVAAAVGVVTALGAGSLRVLLTVALRGWQDLPGGRAAALALALAALLALGGGLLAWSVRRRRGTGGPLARPGTVALLALASTATAQMTHLLLLSGKADAQRAGLLGWPALLVMVAALGAGVLPGLLLAGTASRPAPGRQRLLGAMLLAALLLGALRHHGAPSPSGDRVALAASDGPDVLLVVLDTVRRDAVSAYGAVAGSTPAFDDFARRGLLYEDALAPGAWTVPSHASLFTGVAVALHGAGYERTALRPRPAPGGPPLPTLAEALAARGYRTAAFSCNAHVSRANGFDRGFHEFHEVWRAGQGDYDALGTLARVLLGWGVDHKGGPAAVAGVTAWLARQQQTAPGPRRPWFLFVNLMEAHAPYGVAPEPWRSAFLRPGEPSPAARRLLADPAAHTLRAGVDPALAEELWRVYLGGVRWQDELLGEILRAALDGPGGARVLAVITSDHGEHFGAEGLLGHGQLLDDDLLAIPLALAGPGIPRGLRSDRPASLLDVAPTVRARVAGGGAGGVGAAGPAGREHLLGLDLADPAALPVERPRLAERLPRYGGDEEAYVRHNPGADLRGARAQRAVDRGPDRLLLELGPEGPRLGVTRRVAPPLPPAADGRVPLPPGAPAAVALRALLEQVLSAAPAAPATPAAEPGPLDPGSRAALEALGYLGK